MKKLIFSLVMITNVFGASQAQSQATSDYWFEGYVYKQIGEGVPFLTVVLTEKDNDSPKGITMSSDIGFISFKDIPIDIYKDYVLSVFQGDSLLGRYVREGFKQKPTFTGNLNTHIQLSDYEGSIDVKTFQPTSEEKTMIINTFLEKIGLEIEGATVFPVGKDAPFRLFVNGIPFNQEEIESILSKAPMEIIQQISISEYISPNAYYSGAISISLNVGEKSAFPIDIPLRPLKKL